MANIEYRLERPLWMLLLIPVAILLLVIFFTMKKETRRKGKTILSLTLHGVIALILAILAAGFSIATETDRQSVVILMDVSDSTLSVRGDMTETCEALLAAFPDEDVKGVVLFGQKAVFIGQKSPTGKIAVNRAKADGSDLTSALYEAVDLMNRYTHKRIILLSDGKETVGDALFAARRLSGEGVRIDTLYYDTDGGTQSEVQIRSMTTAGGSYIGDTIALNVTLESNVQGEATVSVYEGETLLEEKTVTLVAGEQTLTFETKAETAGIHSYRASVTYNGDTEAKNNEVFAILETYGDTSILIIADDPTQAEPLKAILSTEAEVTVVSQSQAPDDLPTLCNYDGYYLMNTDAASLPAELGSSLEIAVRVFGKFLCFAGGDQTFSKGNMADTPYSQLLPLEFGSREQGGRILVLVIDNSGSMGGGGRDSLIELAKIGAIKIVESLGPTDQLAVLCFWDSELARTVVKLQPVTLENKEGIISSISSIRAYTGTTYIPPLKEAKRILTPFKDSDKTRHVIFLSDGYPSEHPNTIYKHTQLLHDDGVSLSAIGIGFISDMNLSANVTSFSSSMPILQNMAKLGEGTYHAVSNAQDLPNIMLNQSESIRPQYSFVEPVTPQIAVEDPITEPLMSAGSLPQIGGYVGMHAKEDAVAYLITESGDPLYASWEYGRGQVACFTTDLAGTWSGDFLKSEVGQGFILDALKATYSEVRYDAALIPTVTVDGSRVTVTAELPYGDNDSELLAEITGPEHQKLQLERISDAIYEADTSLGTAGEYTVTVTWRRRAKVVDEAEARFTVSYSGEYDLFRAGDASLLSEMAAVTGGLADASPNDLAAWEPGLLRSVTTFEIWLCLIAALLMLTDVAIRRLTLADIRKLFRRKENVK